MVNITALPSGRNDGNTCSSSPAPLSGAVSGFAAPPSEETLNNPVAVSFVAKTIVSSGPQLPPRGAPVIFVIVSGGPPVIATFLSSRFLRFPVN